MVVIARAALRSRCREWSLWGRRGQENRKNTMRQQIVASLDMLNDCKHSRQTRLRAAMNANQGTAAQ